MHAYNMESIIKNFFYKEDREQSFFYSTTRLRMRACIHACNHACAALCMHSTTHARMRRSYITQSPLTRSYYTVQSIIYTMKTEVNAPLCMHAYCGACVAPCMLACVHVP